MKDFAQVLIAGAKGQLGFEFQKLFSQKGITFVATDIDELDITSETAISHFIKNKCFEYIINCAAYNDVDGAEKDAHSCYLLNSIAPQLLASCAKKIDAIFVTYSTDFVFDGRKNSPYTEDDVPNPLSVYGKSKLEGEKRVFETYQKAFVIRTSWLFGIGGKNFNAQVLEWSKKTNELKIVDDQISVPTYAKDLALFSWLLVQTKKYGLYHISNGGEASKFDQAKYLLEKVGWNGKVLPAKTHEFNVAAKRPSYSKLNSTKCEQAVGQKIPHWQSGIDRWVDEWKKINSKA
ncbi:MAG: dTDP-4-dehydrorhamnose reductase [Spirochaetes bacterium]|nr:dTDP-4-dehydrorhamnose reductase [Spirochaetota bacterium]